MSSLCRTALGAITMTSTEQELETLIADSRQRTWNLQVMQMRPGHSPEDLALLKSLELSLRAETLRHRKALEFHRTTIEHQKQVRHRPRRSTGGRRWRRTARPRRCWRRTFRRRRGRQRSECWTMQT